MGLTKASQPNTLADGTTIFATPLNENFNENETVVNASIDTIEAPPDGFCWDYQITTGIASSDLTVTLVKRDGTTFSASNKGYIRIGNSAIFDISTALSVTLDNADGDYFGWDTGKVQDNDAQLFVYVANNSGTLRIGVSPDPNKVTCGANRFYSSAQQGSAGHTNGVWSGTVASTDNCRVIGRINVKQTDANAWTTPTTSLIINYPIYSTDKLNFTPQTSGASSMTVTLASTDHASYKIIGNQIWVNFSISFTTGGTASNTVRVYTPAFVGVASYYGFALIGDGGTFAPGWSLYDQTNDVIGVLRSGGANWTLGGGRSCYVAITYPLGSN